MASTRKQMVDSLKANTVPFLREHGFRGSFPNFYRDTDGFVSLLNFQFFSSGGSFCVNVAYADPQRDNIYIYKDFPPSKLRPSQASESIRLSPLSADGWFSFGETSYGEVRGCVQEPAQIAAEVTQLMVTRGEEWLRSKMVS